MRLVTATVLSISLFASLGCADDKPEPEVGTSTQTTSSAAQPDVVTPEASQMTIDQVERVSLDDLRDLMDHGQVLLVDVRPPQSFIESHIPGSINIPLAEISARMSELPAHERIVAYCT